MLGLKRNYIQDDMKRSDILKICALAAPLQACTQEPAHPNIIFFLVDDFGWVDTEVAFGPEDYPQNHRHDTPNFLALSRESAILTNAYACPLSSPTRTSIMTGLNSAHTRITNPLASVRGTDNTCPGEVLETADWNVNGLNPAVPGYEDNVERSFYATPFVRLLRDAGYYTIHVGKAHWATAGTPGSNPYNMGFNVNVAGGVVEFSKCGYRSEDNYGNLAGGRAVPYTVQNMTEYYGSGLHLTQALTREALKTLEYPVQEGKPFYLYMSQYAVHTPIQDDPRFYSKYLERGMDEGQARFASMVEGVDVALGEIRSWLEEKGIADNTVIIIMGDNGGNSENLAKGGVRHTQNKPLREGKGSCYEGGTRVPMIVYWKGHVTPGTMLNTPVICEDLFPTILDIAGVEERPTVQTSDGESLYRLLTDGSAYVAGLHPGSRREAYATVVPESISGLDPQRYIVSHYPHQWKPYPIEDIDYLSSIRSGDWKLVYRMLSRSLELYNLADDIGEQHDVAAEHADIVAVLAKALSERLRNWNAGMPVCKGSGLPVPYPDELAAALCDTTDIAANRDI